MKKVPYILLLLILVVNTTTGQSVRKYRYLKPTSYPERIKTVISGKTRNYYAMDTDKPTIILVRGPGKLNIRSRVRFTRGESDKLSYYIQYSLDGEPREEFKLSSERSEHAKYQDSKIGVPGNLEDLVIELGRGEHTIEIYLKSQSPPVAARFKFTRSKTKKRHWIGYCPLTPSEPVNLLAGESSVTYYRFSMENPLKIEVNGPTEMRILTRIENHYQMRGRIQYRIQVKEEGRVINTYQLSSVRSEVTSYEDDGKLIPGKAREFVIDVPKGRHTYEVLPLDKDKTTVLGRLLIPKKDVSLEN